MSERLRIIAQGLLRPSEVVKAVVEVQLNAPATATQDHTRIVVVAAHIEPQNTSQDEGCVLVLKSASNPVLSTSTSKEYYTYEHAFPIIDNLSISMSQSTHYVTGGNRQPNELSPGSRRTALSLTIDLGRDPASEPMSFVTRDLEGLRLLLEEFRRLRTMAHVAKTQRSYSWLEAYVPKPRQSAILSPTPPDLRALHKPVHTLLSPASAGLPGDEGLDMWIIRDDWIRTRVKDRYMASGGPRSSLRIRVGTFNVNGKLPTEDLSAWLRGTCMDERTIPPLNKISPLSLGELAQNPLEKGTVKDAILPPSPSPAPSEIAIDANSPSATHQADPDLFVLAFQELDLSAEALLYSTKTTREDAWSAAMFAALGDKAVLYEKFASRQLVGMLLVVLVKERLKQCFTDVRTVSIGAGIMGMMGNKGATAIRMTYTPRSTDERISPRSTVLTFVNSHLAAFDEMYERRNADFHDLSNRLLFELDTAMTALGTVSASDDRTPPVSVFETDALFWMGDLNYRINLPDSDIRGLISPAEEFRESDRDVLFNYDQLLIARRTRKAFENFLEHPIRHLPSYRFGGGITADALGYDTKRKPAWTDRILQMHSAMIDVTQLSYTSHPEIIMSDHKPVSADFDLHVSVVDANAFRIFVQDLWREVGSIEQSEQTPRVRLSTTFLDLGSFSYRKDSKCSIQIENVGKSPCMYRFISARSEEAILPQWLEADRFCGLLRPGESALVVLTARADSTLAAKLNLSMDRLECTLILRTALGKDHFITVVGTYERTCYATSLSVLARLPGPIRALRSLDELVPAGHAATAPKEYMRIINWLMANSMEAEGLFLRAGDEGVVQTVRECLDTGVEFPYDHDEKDNAVALAFGDTFIRLLQALPEPVIPTNMHATCTQVTSKDEAFELLDALPGVNLNMWISVTAVLHYLAQQASFTARSEQLVAVFASALLPDDPTNMSPSGSVLGKRSFLRYFVL